MSVILPTFNRAPLLKRAVDSVLIQKNVDFELVVVDDGSTDETSGVLASYQEDKRVGVLHQENRGVSAARNRGVERSSGRYVTFLDSDDEWLPGKLEAQLAHSKTSDVVIHQTLEHWVRKGVRVNPPQHSLKKSGDLFEVSLERCMITPSSVFMTRALFEEYGGFDEEYPACEDYELWLRITSKYPVDLIEKNYLIRYGGHSDQLSATPALDRYRIQALDKFLSSGVGNSHQQQQARDVLLGKAGIYAKGCAKRAKLKEVEWCGKLQDKWGENSREPL